MPDSIPCPDPTCTAPAQIVDRWTWGSTAGPVEHVKTGCARGHWFTPTLDSITATTGKVIQGYGFIPEAEVHHTLSMIWQAWVLEQAEAANERSLHGRTI